MVLRTCTTSQQQERACNEFPTVGRNSTSCNITSQMSVQVPHLTTRSVNFRKEKAREEAALRSARKGDCWENESVCSGDRLINEHASRVTWWLVLGMVVVALLLDGIIMQHASRTEATGGPWTQLHASSWIQPTPRALASLVGIVLTLDVYTSYMMALKKGHLDRYMGQFLLSTVLRVALWIFFLYGVSYGGTVGSMISLLVLALMLLWGILTSHSCAPLHTWISMLELGFVGFLSVWLLTSHATVWPKP